MHTVQEYALNEMKGDDADKKRFCAHKEGT